MSKKPAAALSAGLVAVKGMAAPAADMPGRLAPAPVAPPSHLAPAPLVPAAIMPAGNPVERGETGGQPLNFRVSEALRREFKIYAATNGLKLNELLRLSFDAYRRQNGN